MRPSPLKLAETVTITTQQLTLQQTSFVMLPIETAMALRLLEASTPQPGILMVMRMALGTLNKHCKAAAIRLHLAQICSSCRRL